MITTPPKKVKEGKVEWDKQKRVPTKVYSCKKVGLILWLCFGTRIIIPAMLSFLADHTASKLAVPPNQS
jgi:hypothetical protein